MRLTGNTIDIFGCICVVLATYYVYNKAKKTNRNEIRWALLTFAVGFGFQIIIPLLLILTFALIMVILKCPFVEVQRIYANYALIGNMFFLIFNLAGIWLVIRRVSKIPEGKTFLLPPIPPTFDGK